MGGGVTRQRTYMVVAAAMLAALVIWMGTHHRDTEDSATIASPTAAEGENHIPDPPRHERFHATKPTSYPSTQSHTTTRSTAHSAEQPPTTIYRKDKRLVLNLNTADTLDLMQLYNLGPTFARRIVRYRTLLGGYVDKRQLWEIKGMDSVRYNDIAPYLYVDSEAVEQIDLNNVELDRLKRHPYLDYYQAKAIVQLRDRSGAYGNIEEIKKIPIIDNETFNHIAPYLTCNSQPNK